MSFEFRGLSVLSYAQGFSLWLYKSPDSLEMLTSREYFNEACDMLNTGDVIITSYNAGPNSVNGGTCILRVDVIDKNIFVTKLI